MKIKMGFFGLVIIFSFFLTEGFSQRIAPEELQSIVFEEFALKLVDRDFQLRPETKKILDVAKKIIIFPEEVDAQEVILSHPEDILFLTTPPHFIHKHVLVCTFSHNNDIRLTYDPEEDDFFFHTKESVQEKRLFAQMNPSVVYELDYFSLREKIKVRDAEKDYPNFIYFKDPTTLEPTFKRKSDGNYYVEIVTGSRDNVPGQSGNHNWLRLIDNEGKVTSVGMHPKISITGMNGYGKMPVMFYTSDVYEWVDNRTYYIHTFPLLEEEYFALKEDILKDMLAVTDPYNNFDYSVFDYNCADWVICKIAKYFTFNEEDVLTDIYATMMPEWHEYYINELSLQAKTFIDPVLRLIQWGAHVPRLVRALLCGGLTTNEENVNSEPFIKWSLSFLLDVDMHNAVNPFLLEEYFSKHEAEFLEERYQRIDAYYQNQKNSNLGE